MVDHVTGGIINRLIDPWKQVVAAVPKMHGTADVQPADLNDFLRVAKQQKDPDAVLFEFSPVVFRVPELVRLASGNLYIVVRGLLAFNRKAFADEQRLATHSFSTEVAYFARRRDNLAHIFGIHYDFSLSRLGHPAFHAQLKSFAALSKWVKRRYGFGGDPVDEIERILKTVRVPSAQMDVFSVFLQVCADHLLHAHSGPQERAAFDTLLQHAAFCTGAGWRIDHMAKGEAGQCFRSRHWYPSGL